MIMVDIPSAAPKSGRTLGQKIKRWAILAAIAGVLLFVAFASYATLGSYSDGYRVGNVIKLSHKGFVFKTWEGQLDQGYMTQEAGGLNTRIFDFSVHNKDAAVLRAIEKANTNGKRVKLYYHEKFMQLSFLGDTKYFVYQVEEIH